MLVGMSAPILAALFPFPGWPLLPFIARDPFVLKLWQLDFVYVAETTLAHIFMRGYHRIVVPKNEELDYEWARTELQRCEVSDEKIDRALRAA